MSHDKREARSGAGWVEYPLSHGQRALWFLHQLSPESAAYNLVHAARIRSLNVSALSRAFQDLVDRHPVLRTTFAEHDGEPVQRVHSHRVVSVQVEDAFTWSEDYLDARLAEEVYRPFDLARGPLMRLKIFHRAPKEHIALLALHHSITDLWSLALLLYELGELYAAHIKSVPASLKPVRAEYADYVRWQQEMLDGPEGERLWAYWREQLSGDLPALDIPTDFPRQPLQTYRGATSTLRLDAELVQSLRSLAKQYDTTLFTVMLAAFQVLLHRYTGQDDILVGTPKAGRSRQLARTLGYFVNSVVIRADVAGDPSFSDFIGHIHSTVQGAFEHDAFPFPLLVEKLQPDRDASRSPLFQVMFAWQKTTRAVDSQAISSFALNEDRAEMAVGTLALESLALAHRVVPFELTLLVAEAGDGLALSMEYNTDLFAPDTIKRMLGHFRNVLEGVAANPEQRISMLPLLTHDERCRLLEEWNHTALAPLPYRSVHRLFEAQVAARPNAVAVVLDETQLTYAGLNRRANQLAHHLCRLGVGPGAMVGVLVERSIEAVIGFLAVLKAGGVYLPLDLAYPQERLAFMLDDARVEALLTQRHLRAKIGESANWPTASHVPTVFLDTDWAVIAQEPTTDLARDAAPDQVAYVIYTSGSTGLPKGVCISHVAIAQHCLDIGRRFELTADDRVLQFASYVFDQSVEQILTALIGGATLVLRGPEVWPPADFSRIVADFGLTVINLPPAYWHQWVQDWSRTGVQMPQDQLRLVIIGGDMVLPETLRLWQETPMRSARLLNAYGPTETTVTALTYQVPPGWHGGRVPIGRPPANRTIYILDRHGQPAPVGVAGELYIGGLGVAQGYLNRPELTAERFVPDPFAGLTHLQDPSGLPPRLYKTGDLARFLPDGNVEFLGRVDQQVKIRGFRIELGEIEAVLGRHPAVREAAVAAWQEGPDKRLVAYLVASGESIPTVSEMRAFVQASLPEYMVPLAFVWLEAMPLTPSGKVNRRALPVPDGVRPEMEDAFVAPRSPIEQELAGMWAGVLGVERVGVHDSFFHLGGHSLLATQLVSRVRTAYQVELPLRQLFERPTVAGLAALVEQSLIQAQDNDELASLLDELEGLSDETARGLLMGEASLPAEYGHE
ncbi:MAG: amino acid adenylation domain-containing protein [Chloroflexota bacterium]